MIMKFVYNRIKAIHRIRCRHNQGTVWLDRMLKLLSYMYDSWEIDQGTYSSMQAGRLARSFLKQTSIWHEQSGEMRLQSLRDSGYSTSIVSAAIAGFTCDAPC
jgi:hypothetical protein